MSKFKHILTVLVVIVLSYGCDDYLEVQPTVEVSEEKLFDNLSGLQVVLNGVYKFMLTGNNGINRGIAGMQAYNLTASPDLWIREIGNGYYFSSIFEPARTESGGAYANNIWNYHYKIINNCNIILENVDNFEGQLELSSSIKGQALAIRGWAYFNLVRYYQQTYSIAKNEPGIPIYLDRATPERPQKDRNTVEDVYSQILSDLNDGLESLSGWEAPSMEFIDTNVINGILAQVYLTMENWSEAANYANAARADHALMGMEEYTNGFHTSNPEWIWGFRQTENDNIQDTNLFARWNINLHRPAGTVFGDATLRVNLSFVNMFDDTDVRNQFYYVDNGAIDSGWASNKFRDDGHNPPYLGDMIVMRAAEMYLIEAEAWARQGGEGINKALELLNELQAVRQVEAPTSTNVQSELLEAIWVEKRKELYSEGLIFFDLLRNQLPLIKLGELEGGDAREPINIPSRSYRFILQIPNDEINFGGITKQNPLDGIL